MSVAEKIMTEKTILNSEKSFKVIAFLPFFLLLIIQGLIFWDTHVETFLVAIRLYKVVLLETLKFNSDKLIHQYIIKPLENFDVATLKFSGKILLASTFTSNYWQHKESNWLVLIG